LLHPQPQRHTQTLKKNILYYQYCSRQAENASAGGEESSKGPGVDDLDAGLHARPGPVVGDGADDAAEPQRPCNKQ
jgi:hypothetical protein